MACLVGISIITVVRNRVGQIDRCLNSVFEQSYRNVEHIIIDGASSDGTIEKINQFVKRILPYKALVSSGSDDGIYSAINRGITLCSGDVVGLLHSDDTFYDRHVLDLVSRTFEANPSIDYLYGDIVFVRSDNSFHSFRSSLLFYFFGVGLGFMPAHTALFVKRSVFEVIGNYNSRYHIAGDFDFCVRLASSKGLKGLYLRKNLVKMEIGGASTSGIKSKFKIFLEKVEIFSNNNYSFPYFRAFARYMLILTFPIIWFFSRLKRWE